MIKKLILIVGGIAAGAAIFFFYRQEGAGSVTQYTTEPVQTGSILVSVSGSGNISLKESVDVTTEVSGEVTEVLIKEGDTVNEGDLLLRIENQDLDISLNNAWIAYNQAKETLERKKLDAEKARDELADLEEQDEDDPDSVTDLDLEYARQAIRAADLDVEAAENTVWSRGNEYNELKEQAADKELKAPVDGTIISLNVEVGDEIGSGSTGISSGGTESTGLLTIAALDQLVAEISLNEVDIPLIEVSQLATLTYDAVDDYTSTGKVVDVDQVGVNSQGLVNYTVTIELDSVDARIKSGMTVDAAIITTRKDDAVYVPNAAVKTSGGQTYVQVLQNDQPVDKTVEVGISNDEVTEVISGLSVGELVVTATIDSSSSSSEGSQSGNQGGGFAIPGMGGVRGVMR